MDPENQWAVTSRLTEVSEETAVKDRITGLTIYGCIMLALGGLSALMVPFMLLSIAIAPTGNTSAGQMVPAIGVYAIAAIAFVTLGIGSMRARRWARALTLVLAWMWLVMGVISLLSMLVFMPSMSGMMAAQGQQLPAAAMNAFLVVMFAVMIGMYILLPAVFIVFYQRSDVKATCDYRDSTIRWTDLCPLPVLSLSLLLAFGATSIIWSAGYGFVMPFFGILLKGVPGALLVLSCSILCAYLAWATYKLKMSAWWATLGFSVLFGLSTVISFTIINMLDLYREMGFPEEQIKMMDQSGVFDMPIPLMMAVNVALFIGYLLWLRNYFRNPVRPAPSGPP